MRTNRKLKNYEFFMQTARNVNHNSSYVLLKPKHVARSTVKYIKAILVIFAPLSLSDIHTFQQDVQPCSLNGAVNTSPNP